MTLFCSCSASEPLFTIRSNDSVRNYKYVYIAPTQTVSQDINYGQAYSNPNNNNSGSRTSIYSTTVRKTTNPSSVIAGWAMKKGYTVIPEISSSIADQTIIINCAETNRRMLNEIIEITIQCVSARTYEVICTCSSESSVWGDEPTKVKATINKCMKVIFR